MACDRWNLLHPAEAPRTPWVTQQLSSRQGPVVAASDFMRNYPDLVRNWVPGRFTVLGTDGFGRSDTRVALRDFFEIDERYITLAAIQSLVAERTLPRTTLDGLIESWASTPTSPVRWPDRQHEQGARGASVAPCQYSPHHSR